MEGMLSPADVAVLSGNAGGNRQGGNSGFGDGAGAWWIIILIVLLGWGRNGFGGNQGGGNSGGGESNYYYGGALGMPNIYGKLDGISYGIADSTFALNNSITNGFAGVQQTLCQGFSGINTAIAQSGFNTERGLWNLSSQFADCCCKTQRGLDGIAYNISEATCGIKSAINNSTRDILESNNNNTRAILDFLVKDKIDTLQTENQSLRLAASQADQNAVLRAAMDANTAEIIRRTGNDCPVPAYVVNGPTPINFPVNCCGTFTGFNNNSCGCGCGCNNY